MPPGQTLLSAIARALAIARNPDGPATPIPSRDREGAVALIPNRDGEDAVAPFLLRDHGSIQRSQAPFRAVTKGSGFRPVQETAPSGHGSESGAPLRGLLPVNPAPLSRDREGAAVQCPPDWIQIREKDLSARDLFELTRSVLNLPNPKGVKILINTRIDVALAAGAAGAHLPSNSPPPHAWRAITPLGFLLGVSCHSTEEVRAAAAEGADYIFFGPVLAPLSKAAQSPPVGLAGLASAVAAAAKIPVLALGGITHANAAACAEAGAAGVAGISLYQSREPHPLQAW